MQTILWLLDVGKSLMKTTNLQTGPFYKPPASVTVRPVSNHRSWCNSPLRARSPDTEALKIQLQPCKETSFCLPPRRTKEFLPWSSNKRRACVDWGMLWAGRQHLCGSQSNWRSDQDSRNWHLPQKLTVGWKTFCLFLCRRGRSPPCLLPPRSHSSSARPAGPPCTAPAFVGGTFVGNDQPGSSSRERSTSLLCLLQKSPGSCELWWGPGWGHRHLRWRRQTPI